VRRYGASTARNDGGSDVGEVVVMGWLFRGGREEPDLSSNGIPF